jgi:hypothetical protein
MLAAKPWMINFIHYNGNWGQLLVENGDNQWNNGKWEQSLEQWQMLAIIGTVENGDNHWRIGF